VGILIEADGGHQWLLITYARTVRDGDPLVLEEGCQVAIAMAAIVFRD
jgi:hypothetical protein